MSAPDFLVAGVPKAGTTSLYHYLGQHPDIFLSAVKEPCFFVSEFRAENMALPWRERLERDAGRFAAYLAAPNGEPPCVGLVKTWSDYLNLFQAAGEQQLIGEASVACLWSKQAAQAIQERIPAARMIVMLRHPADRAFSQYRFAMSEGPDYGSFGELIRGGKTDLGLYHRFNPFLQFGSYAPQLERFLAQFAADQIRIYLYDDFAREPGPVMRDIFGFLGLRRDVSLDLSRRHNQPRVPRFPRLERPLRTLTQRWRLAPSLFRKAAALVRFRPAGEPRMVLADRRYLIDYYRDDIGRVERLIGRDLSRWLVC